MNAANIPRHWAGVNMRAIATGTGGSVDGDRYRRAYFGDGTPRPPS
jgi:hypothetical protein